MVYGANRAELETNRSAFISAINPIYGKSVLLWKRANGVIVALDVIPDDGTPSFRNDVLDNATSWKGYCDFIAFDPCYYDENEVESTVQGYIGGFTLPFRCRLPSGTSDSLASLYNAGDTPTVYYYAHRNDGEPDRYERYHGGIYLGEADDSGQ